MTMSRWKLLAGVFGLGVCGLAALAEPACRTTGHRQQPPVAENKPKDEPKPVTGGTAPPPLEILPPVPGEVKPAPAPSPLPSLPPASLDPKPAEPKPTTPAPVPAPTELTLPMVNTDKAKPSELPAFPPLTPQPSPAPNIPGATAVPEAQPGAGALPLPGTLPNPSPATTGAQLPALPGLPPAQAGTTQPVGKGADLPPLPGTQPKPLDVQPLPTPAPQPQPEVRPLPLPGTQPTPPIPAPLPTPTPLPTPEVKPVEARSTPVVEKRLKVSLQMGDGNPRFEIRDGDEVVLKVVSDKIDVKAPTEKGDLWSTLKASGRVKFQSPGGDGFCDELTISPGTCEVVATGKVQFKYNWGKVETAVTSERMTFRLGAMPDSR